MTHFMAAHRPARASAAHKLPGPPGRADLPHPQGPGALFLPPAAPAQACGVGHRGATRSRLATKNAPKPTGVKWVNINEGSYKHSSKGVDTRGHGAGAGFRRAPPNSKSGLLPDRGPNSCGRLGSASSGCCRDRFPDEELVKYGPS